MNNPNYRNPAVTRLKSEHALLTTEISLLGRELIILKDIIRRKQKGLRDINTALIHKVTRGPFLSVVPSSAEYQSIKRADTTIEALLLHCLQGGKHSCK